MLFIACLTFLVLGNLGSPGKTAIRRLLLYCIVFTTNDIKVIVCS